MRRTAALSSNLTEPFITMFNMQSRQSAAVFPFLSLWLLVGLPDDIGTPASCTAAERPRIYRDRVEPKWFSGGSHFWYRVDLSDGAKEFIAVDIKTGQRDPAFDHADVAAKLSKLLEKPVVPEQLPVETLEFEMQADSDSILKVSLQGPEGTFVLDAQSGVLTRSGAAEAGENPPLFMPQRNSGNSSTDTQLIVVNEFSEEVSLWWIDTGGVEHSYGVVAAGATRHQHTFVSHVWMFKRADGTSFACVEAQSGETRVVLNTAAAESVRDEGNRIGRGRRNRRRSNQKELSEPVISPDGKLEAFVREHNLWIRSATGSDNLKELALSTDAGDQNTFRRDSSRARLINLDYDHPEYPEQVPEAFWSPDSRFVMAWQTTPADERRVSYVESSPADQLQPKLHSYPYLKAGDVIPIQRPRLFDVVLNREVPVSSALCPNPWSMEFLRWSADSGRFWLLYNERGHQAMRVLEVIAETGQIRPIVEEVSSTFIHYSSDGKFELRWLRDNQLLWASERSGWNHLYQYNTETADVMNAVTQGTWNVRRIDRIDETAGQVWFYAVGIRSDQDPYHEHFCRVNLDGTGMTILTDGDGTHRIEWSPDSSVFLDRWSRVDLPPVTDLRRASDGSLICRLESADASEVLQERGRFPERFVAKGRDGQTDIWGIIHRPKDFDDKSVYPVIENIYAGPHNFHVPKAFQAEYRCKNLADNGFIVVQIDGMGTAWRSKAFHDICYRNLKDAGFPDRIAWIRAAAVRFPQMDISRVGIYGGSAGGQNAMAALLWHNDFYSAAVADCGCHDNRMDKIWWNEQWLGLPQPGDHYTVNSNMENAGLLKGQLMLVVGELDRNVDPASTSQVASKLMAADRDFDFVVIPGAGHGACETPWGSRRRIQFFLRTLQPNIAAGSPTLAP